MAKDIPPNQEEVVEEVANESVAEETVEADNEVNANEEVDTNEVDIEDLKDVDGDDEDSEDIPKEKKSLFGKKKNKDQEKIAELEDKVMRQMAEFENFRRRSEKEKQQMFETGAKSIIEKILPVVDNFERGLAAVSEEEKGTAFVSGMDMIYKQLITGFEGIGVKAIEAVGSEFDPNLHNAVMQVASEEFESGIVAQELQKGYTYRETVVRHSMVAVVE